MELGAVSHANLAAASTLAAGAQVCPNNREKRMSPIAAGTAIGAAALTLGRGAVGAVGNGLSFAAELMRATSGTTSAAERPVDSSIAAKKAIQQRIDELQQRIQQQLAATGIRLSQPLELVSDGAGGIAVAGPHPEQAAIEEVLGQDVLLERDFNMLTSDYDEFVNATGAVDLPPTLTITIPKSP